MSTHCNIIAFSLTLALTLSSSPSLALRPEPHKVGLEEALRPDPPPSSSPRQTGLEEVALEPFTDSVLKDPENRQRLEELLGEIHVGRALTFKELERPYRNPDFSFIARDGGGIIGMAVASRTVEEPWDTLYLSWIAVDKDKPNRRKGVGRRLMEAVWAKFLEETTLRQIVWDTPRSETGEETEAQKFFKSLGVLPVEAGYVPRGFRRYRMELADVSRWMSENWRGRLRHILEQFQGRETEIAQLWWTRHRAFERNWAHEVEDDAFVGMVMQADPPLDLRVAIELRKPVYPKELSADWVAHSYRWLEVPRAYLLPIPKAYLLGFSIPEEPGDFQPLEPLDLILADQLIDKIVEGPDLDQARGNLAKGNFRVRLTIPWHWIRRMDRSPHLNRQEITLHDFFRYAMEKAGYVYSERLEEELTSGQFRLEFAPKTKESGGYQDLSIIFFPQPVEVKIGAVLEPSPSAGLEEVDWITILETGNLEERLAAVEELSRLLPPRRPTSPRRQASPIPVFNEPPYPFWTRRQARGDRVSRSIGPSPTDRDRALRGLLLESAGDLEQTLFRKLAQAAWPLMRGKRYRINLDPELIQGADLKELDLIKGAFIAQVELEAGARVEFSDWQEGRSPQPGVREVSLLSPETAGGLSPEDGGLVLVVQWSHEAKETRLLSRPILSGLAVLSMLPRILGQDEVPFIGLQRYFRLLGVSASRQDLEDLITGETTAKREARFKLQLNLRADPLKLLLSGSFDRFLDRLSLDLSV